VASEFGESDALPDAVFHLAKDIADTPRALFGSPQRYLGSENQASNWRPEPAQGILLVAETSVARSMIGSTNPSGSSAI